MFRPALGQLARASRVSRTATRAYSVPPSTSPRSLLLPASLAFGLALGGGLYLSEPMRAESKVKEAVTSAPAAPARTPKSKDADKSLLDQPIHEPAHKSGEDESVAEKEEEARSQGAFNEETGEINWDCPCLGGMADGPCGEEFKEAFSCFVFSTQEPKGIDCVEKFKHMQDCFRAHPDVYGEEDLDDEDDEAPPQAAESGPEGSQPKSEVEVDTASL